MKRFMTLVAVAALAVGACGAGASPTPTPATPTAAPTATPAPSASPTAGSVTVHVTFDGKTCTYAGPSVVMEGTNLLWTFENTPAAIEASTTKGAKSLGSDLVILPTVAGTTWDTVVATKPAPDGTKGDWRDPAWALMDGLQVGYGSSMTVMTVATGNGYYVGCHLYWNYETGTPFAFYPATLVQVLKG
jgi:hypothetical protein